MENPDGIFPNINPDKSRRDFLLVAHDFNRGLHIKRRINPSGISNYVIRFATCFLRRITVALRLFTVMLPHCYRSASKGDKSMNIILNELQSIKIEC